MMRFKSLVKNEDTYLEKLLKFIPIEVVGVYIAITGYLAYDANTQIPSNYVLIYKIVIITLFIITLFWTYFSVLDKTNSSKESIIRALFQALVSCIAFLVWVFAIGNPILEYILCDGGEAGSSACPLYSQEFGSITLALFSLIVPLIDRIIFGTTLPPPSPQELEKK